MNGLKQTLMAFWEQRNQRERRMLIAAIAAVLAALFYMLLIDPAISGRGDLEKKLPVLRQQLAELQSLSKEATALSGKAAAAPAATVTRESIEASLARRGLKPQSVSLTGEIAKVQLPSASFAGLVDWLEETQRTARMSVVEANVEALTEADMVKATLTLRQQGGGTSQ